MGLLNTAIEEQKKAGLLNRSAGAVPEPRRIVPATIQAPKQGPIEKTARGLFNALPRPIRKATEAVGDALLGNRRDRAVMQGFEEAGLPPDFVTRLKVEGFLPFLGKDKAEIISENVGHLVEKGVDPKRAEELAFYDTFKEGLPIGAPREAGERLKALQPTKLEERVLGIARLGNRLGLAADVVGIAPVGSLKRVGSGVTTKTIEKLGNRSTVSRQFIEDLTNAPDIKQPERDLFRRVLEDEPAIVNVPKFINRVRGELLPLNVSKADGPMQIRYESVNLPDNLRGPVANYEERIYESPIKTGAGKVHFSGFRRQGKDPESYFAHTRVEDLPSSSEMQGLKPVFNEDEEVWELVDETGEVFESRSSQSGEIVPLQFEEEAEAIAALSAPNASTRRVIELQSDLFQKGRLEEEARMNLDPDYEARLETLGEEIKKASTINDMKRWRELTDEYELLVAEGAASKKKSGDFSKLEPYRNIWHERVIREEIRQAAIDGKTKLQFPTGETAMKIEGLGENSRWSIVELDDSDDGAQRIGELMPDNMKVGQVIDMEQGDNMFSGNPWIITEVIGDGKFKAAQTMTLDNSQRIMQEAVDLGLIREMSSEAIEEAGGWSKIIEDDTSKQLKNLINNLGSETFDVSGKIDTQNPIYRFYEKTVAKYLTNKYGAKRVKDPQGVEWMEIDIDPALKGKPVEAFGAGAGIQPELDEEGNIIDVEVNPLAAVVGVGAAGFLKNRGNRGISTKGIQELQRSGKSPTPERIGEAFDNQYTAGNGKPQTLDEALEDSAITTSEPELQKRVADTLRKGFTDTVEFLQDTDKRILDLQTKFAPLGDESNIYQKLTAMPGKLGDLVEKGRDTVKTVFENMGKYAKEADVKFETLREEVNDYLWVKHAPERNAALGDKAAGISTEEATKRMKEIEASPHFAKVKEFADELATLNTKTLDMLRDAEVISDELYDTLRTKYKSHVPLNRLFDESEDVGEILSGRGLDVKSSGVKTAKGSEREVADIVENIMINYEQAAIRSEKNIVDLATLKFVNDNKNGLKDLMKVRKPKAVGETFDGKPLMERTQDPQILQLMEKGKPVWIEIKDPQLAAAMRGVGREKLGTILNAVGAFTRFYSGLMTRFNPDFAAPNKIRDLQEVMVYLSAQKDIGAKAALKTAVRDPISLKAIFDSIRGVDSEGARLYNEMKKLGGTTGGMGLSTRKKVQMDIRELEKLAQSKPRQVWEKTIEYVDNWNTIFEDSTRLSVYRTAIEQGLSKERAAFLAKEASVNFNRMGKGGPVINALYMFANASIQGSAKMIRSLKNPKVAAGVTAIVGASVAAINQWNDQVDPEWRQNVSKWDRLNSLPLVLPSEDGTVRYLSLPVSWGIKPIKVMADYAYDAAAGKGFDGAKAAEDLFTSVAEAYNPIGGSDWFAAATPTILDVPAEIARNLSWSGGPIKPDQDPYAPESIKYFDSLEKKGSGQFFIGMSQLLSGQGIEVSPADLNHAYEQYIGGAGRFVNKLGNTVFGAATGKLPPISEFPFLSRFYKEKQADEVFNTESNDAIRELMAGDKKERFYVQKKAEEEWEMLQDLTPDEKRARLKEIATQNPELAEKILDVGEAEKMGLTGKEKQLKFATVAVRAQFIANEIAKAKSKEERKQIILNYREKKILTDSVLDAMEELLAEKKK